MFWPIEDDVTLARDMAAKRLAGQIPRIPLLSGTNANEGRILAVLDQDLDAYLERNLPNASSTLLDRIHGAYPVGGWEFPQAYDAIAQIETDLSFHCGAALVANDTADVGIPSWRYYVGPLTALVFFLGHADSGY